MNEYGSSMSSTQSSFVHQRDVTDDIFGYTLTALFILGVCGNLLGVIVLTKLQKTQGGVRLLKFLGIVDIILLFLLFENQILTLFPEQPRTMVVILGGVNTFTFPLGLTCYTFEIYLTVLIAGQRAVAVSRPLQSAVYVRKSVINICILVIFIFSIVLNIPYWLIYKLELFFDQELNMTWITSNYSNFVSSTFNHIFDKYVILVLRALVPLVALIVCNILIVRSARTTINTEIRRKKSDHLAPINIAIGTMSIVTHITTAAERALNIEISQITSLLLIINCSTNFIFYCAFGRIFQKTLKDLFKK